MLVEISLNSKQAKGLANFFFDVAKGLTLGGIGFAIVIPAEVKVMIVAMSSVLALACLIFALTLLEGFE